MNNFSCCRVKLLYLSLVDIITRFLESKLYQRLSWFTELTGQHEKFCISILEWKIVYVSGVLVTSFNILIFFIPNCPKFVIKMCSYYRMTNFASSSLWIFIIMHLHVNNLIQGLFVFFTTNGYLLLLKQSFDCVSCTADGHERLWLSSPLCEPNA